MLMPMSREERRSGRRVKGFAGRLISGLIVAPSRWADGEAEWDIGGTPAAFVFRGE